MYDVYRSGDLKLILKRRKDDSFQIDSNAAKKFKVCRHDNLGLRYQCHLCDDLFLLYKTWLIHHAQHTPKCDNLEEECDRIICLDCRSIFYRCNMCRELFTRRKRRNEHLYTYVHDCLHEDVYNQRCLQCLSYRCNRYNCNYSTNKKFLWDTHPFFVHCEHERRPNFDMCRECIKNIARLTALRLSWK